MAESGSGSGSDPEYDPSPSTTPQQTSLSSGRASSQRYRRTDPSLLYSGAEESSSQPGVSYYQARRRTQPLATQNALPTPPISSQILNQTQNQSSQPIRAQSSPTRHLQDLDLNNSTTQPLASLSINPSPDSSRLSQLPRQKHSQTENDESAIPQPVEDGDILSGIDLLNPPSHLIRPNRYLGPASTWRSWTEEERTVAASLDRARATDLSIHLYNSFILRKKANTAESTRPKQRGRREVSRANRQSRSRSRSKGKGKGKAKATDTEEVSDNETQESRTSSRSPYKLDDDDNTPFRPPRSWTAWPMTPTTVPREPFLPHIVTSSDHDREGYRRPADVRPSAELEACLLALTTRFAKEMWEAREWESDGEVDPTDSEHEQPNRRRKKRKRDDDGDNDDDGDSDVEMGDHRNDIPMFSSQMFGRSASPSTSTSFVEASPLPSKQTNPPTTTTNLEDTSDSPQSSPSPSSQSQPLSSPSSSSPSSSTKNSIQTRTQKGPVFSSDDAKIHHLLLPSTRHTITQLNTLLHAISKSLASHKSHPQSKSKHAGKRSGRTSNTNTETETDLDLETDGSGKSKSRGRGRNSSGNRSRKKRREVRGQIDARQILNFAEMVNLKFSVGKNGSGSGSGFEERTLKRVRRRCEDLGIV